MVTTVFIMKRSFINQVLQSFLLVGLLVLSQLAVAKVTAKVDRQFAYEGETITLSVRAENSPNAREPDFSPLLENFHIGGTSKSSSISIINGRSSSSLTWSVRLQPKKLGEIEIPSLSVGQESSMPFKIEIKPVPIQSGSQGSQPLFITLEIDSKATRFYVQQHIPLVTRLYYKHDINQGQITDPAPQNAILERLGDDIRYTTQYNGQDYKVFERRYSLLAEKSGELHIPSIHFQGNISKPQSQQGGQRRHDPFSTFFSTPLITQGQPVSIRSKPIDLVIESHPSEFDGQQWLPAESVLLRDSWTKNPPVFKVGEPVSRTITLEAKGLVASQIKPLELPSISSFRRYAEPAETETRTDGQSVYAISHRTFTYIPAYPGEQEIPEFTLKWWNVITQKQETARLAPWKINVEKGLDNTPAAPPSTANVAGQSQTTPSAPALQESTSADIASADVITRLKMFLKDYVYWIAAFFIIVLAILILLARRKTRPGKDTAADSQPEIMPDTADSSDNTLHQAVSRETINSKQLLQDLRDACEHNNAQQAARTLLQMAQQTWPENPPRSIGALAESFDTGRHALQELDRYLYSGSREKWNGQEICELFKRGFKVKADDKSAKPVLRPLYPEQP